MRLSEGQLREIKEGRGTLTAPEKCLPELAGEILELREMRERFVAWQTRAVGIISPLSETPCTGVNPPAKSCLDLGITGHSACLRCKAKHLRENP